MKTRVPPNGWTPRVISCAQEWHKEVGWKLLCKENPLLDSSKSSSEIRAQHFISFHTQKTWAGWFPWLSNSSWFSAPLFRDQTTKKPHRTKLITIWNGINNMWHPPTFNKTTQSNIWNLHLKKNKVTCVLKWGKITWGGVILWFLLPRNRGVGLWCHREHRSCGWQWHRVQVSPWDRDQSMFGDVGVSISIPAPLPSSALIRMLVNNLTPTVINMLIFWGVWALKAPCDVFWGTWRLHEANVVLLGHQQPRDSFCMRRGSAADGASEHTLETSCSPAYLFLRLHSQPLLIKVEV